MHDGDVRREIFDSAVTLAETALDPRGPTAWEPLRDLLLAGFEAGGLRYGSNAEALRQAAGELAAVALDARRSEPT